MRFNHAPEELKRAQRNGAAKRNGRAPLTCPHCGGRSFATRIRQPQFLACNNCKAVCTIAEATHHAKRQRERKSVPASVVRESKRMLLQRYEYEWRALKRNAHEHAQLAMLVRK